MKIKTIFRIFPIQINIIIGKASKLLTVNFQTKLQLSSPDLGTPIDSRSSIPSSNSNISCANLIKSVHCTKCFDSNVKVLVAWAHKRRISSVLRKSCCNCFGTRSMSSKTCELLQNIVMRNRNKGKISIYCVWKVQHCVIEVKCRRCNMDFIEDGE